MKNHWKIIEKSLKNPVNGAATTDYYEDGLRRIVHIVELRIERPGSKQFLVDAGPSPQDSEKQTAS